MDNPFLPRSPKWRPFRAHWLAAHGACAACGGTASLEVHHVEPVHIAPGRELDNTNVITLCEGPNRCHFLVGHLGDWRNSNPDVVAEAARRLALRTSALRNAENTRLAPRLAGASALVLRNGVTRDVYKSRIPTTPLLRPIDPWEMDEKGYGQDVQQWELMADFVYDSDRVGLVTVPKGFVTDLASVPLFLQSIVQSDAPYIIPGCLVHDWLYSNAGTLQSGGWATFRVVNKVLAEAMWYSNATPAQIREAYLAVAVGGKSTWNADCDRLGVPGRKV